jgi:hypothetical protein
MPLTPERKEYMRQWRSKHPEISARWRAKNPDYAATYWAEKGAKYNDPVRHRRYYVYATEAKRLRAILL